MKELIALLFCILMLNPLVGADEIISRNRTTTSTTIQKPQESPDAKSIDTGASERRMNQGDNGWNVNLDNPMTYILVYVLGVLTGIVAVAVVVRTRGAITDKDKDIKL